MAISSHCSQDIGPTAGQEMDPLPGIAQKVECSLSKPVNPPAIGKMRIIKTCSLFANFALLLAASSQTSAALIDIADLYSVSLAKISVFLSVSCVALISGTWVGGLLYSRVNLFALLVAFSATYIAALATCTFMPRVEIFFVAAAIWSVASGAIDSIVNSHFLALWDGERIRDSLMQALHACWSAGAMGMGATLKLFLNPDLQAHRNQTAAVLSTPSPSPYPTSSSYSTSSPFPSPSPLPTASSSTRVRYAYLLFACVALIPLCSHVALLAWDKRRLPGSRRHRHVSVAVADAAEVSKAKDMRLTGWWKLVPVAFAVLIRVFDVEMFISAFLPSYLFYGLGWSTPDASVAFSVFFAGQFSGRLLSVVVSAFVRPVYILLVNGCLIVVCGIVLGLFGHISIVPYVTSFFMGIGNSSSFPSVFLWLSDFTPITGLVSSSLFLGDLTTLLSPAFGHVMETTWPAFFYCFASASGFLSVCSLIVGHIVGKRLLAAQVAKEADAAERKSELATAAAEPLIEAAA